MDRRAGHGGLECHIQDVRLECGDKKGAPQWLSVVPWPYGSCGCSLGVALGCDGSQGGA